MSSKSGKSRPSPKAARSEDRTVDAEAYMNLQVNHISVMGRCKHAGPPNAKKLAIISR